uniref:Uncharacterized protein n=1 Tax=Anguilla anguilla TaxID=7936 RepID=A0A0E9TX74_ANGAN
MVCPSAYHRKVCLLQHYSITQFLLFFLNSVSRLVTS